MELSHRRIDVQACLDRGKAVQDVIARRPGETWLVAFNGIRTGQKVEWTRFTKEDQILVPLVPYLIVPAPEMALAYTLSLGAQAIESLGGIRIRKLHLSVGVPVNDMHDEAHGHVWQYYVGVAVML